MQLQTEDPPVARPLATLPEDYGQAVLHIAWDRNAKTGERTLVFAFVELLPHEVPPPIDDYDGKGHRLSGFSDHHLYVRHAVLTSEQALDWYLACRGEIAILPENDGRLLGRDDPHAKRLKLARIGEDPPWPTLVTWSPERTALLFCPHWMEHPRLHSLVPLAPFDLQALWSTPRERDEAVEELHNRLHFDLRRRPELWGSVHLLAPNPVYRRKNARLRPGVPPVESELIRFQPRAGKRVEGLELSIQHRRPWGPVDVRRVTVQSPLLEVRYPTTLHATRTEVWDPLRGMLEAPEHAHGFVRSFELNMGIVERVVVQGRAAEDRFEVDRGQFERRGGGKQPAAESAHSRLIGAHYESRARNAAEDQGQRWFQGEKEEARAYLRSLLHQANREVWIVDPYFGANELLGFLFAVSDTDVPIRVLTSAKGLDETVEVDPSEGRDPSQIQKIKADELFAAQLPSVLPQLRNPLHVRVMLGKSPDIHDRFLVLDDWVLSVGSSLNNLGERGTMLLAVPDPKTIQQSLRAAWGQAQDFDAWYQNRKERRAEQLHGSLEAAE